jgi:hypothetical protein
MLHQSSLIDAASIEISWQHVDAHNGEPGNEAADLLANEGARKYLPPNVCDSIQSSEHAPVNTTPRPKARLQECSTSDFLLYF